MEQITKLFGTLIGKARQEAVAQTTEQEALKHDIVMQKIRMALIRIDRSNASVACELVRLRCADDVLALHNQAWDGLKQLLRKIENGKEVTP